MPDLDVFLQDQAAAEGAFSFCAIPRGEEGAGLVPEAQPKTKTRDLRGGGLLEWREVSSPLRQEAGGKVLQKTWGHGSEGHLLGGKRKGARDKGYLHG